MAFQAAEDGTNMRVIAAVTLFFLPGTFTAVITTKTIFESSK
jgi:hypothetical protein